VDSCSGRARIASFISVKPIGPTSGTSTSYVLFGPTPPATGASAP